MRQRSEQLGGHAGAARHPVAHRGDQGQVAFDPDGVRFAVAADLGEHGVLHRREVVLVDHDAHGVDAGRRELVAHALGLQDAQHAAAEAVLLVHQRLLDLEQTESVAPGHPGDGPVGGLVLGNDQGPRVPGSVGVGDADGDPRLLAGEDGLLVEHVGSGIGELPQFAVGDALHGSGVGDHAWVGHQQARDVGPVFVQDGAGRARQDGPGDVRAAAREGLDLALRPRAVESGKHADPVGDPPGKLLPGPLVHQSVRCQEHGVFRLHEGPAQVGRHDAGGEVFTAGGDPVAVGSRQDRTLEGVEEGWHSRVHAQFAFDLQEPFAQQGEGGIGIEFPGNHVVDGEQDVRHLGVLLVAFPGSGDDHGAPSRVGPDDVGHLAELVGVGKGSPPELASDGFRWRVQAFRSLRLLPGLPPW